MAILDAMLRERALELHRRLAELQAQSSAPRDEPEPQKGERRGRLIGPAGAWPDARAIAPGRPVLDQLPQPRGDVLEPVARRDGVEAGGMPQRTSLIGAGGTCSSRTESSSSRTETTTLPQRSCAMRCSWQKR